MNGTARDDVAMANYSSTARDLREANHFNVSEKVTLVDKKHRVSIHTASLLRKGAIVLSWISVVVSLILGIVAVVFAWRNDSQSLFSFGLDAILDCLSSFIVLWRFYGGDSLYSEFKERRACAIIGMLFVIASFLLAGKSIWAIAKLELTEQPGISIILAGINALFCLLLGTSKIVLGYKLESRALITDSIITLVGMSMSIFTLIFSVIYKRNKDLWYLDDSFGLLCSAFLLLYGLRVLWVSVSHGQPSTSNTTE